MKRFQFKDNEYPYRGFTHKRVIVRAFVINNDSLAGKAITKRLVAGWMRVKA